MSQTVSTSADRPRVDRSSDVGSVAGRTASRDLDAPLGPPLDLANVNTDRNNYVVEAHSQSKFKAG